MYRAVIQRTWSKIQTEVAGDLAVNAPLLHTVEGVYEGKAPGNSLCTADEYKGTVGSQVLRYSSPGVLQMKDRCESNFKDAYQINSEIYCYNRLKEYTSKPTNCFFPPFCLRS